MERENSNAKNNFELSVIILEELLDQNNAKIQFLPQGTYVYIEDKFLEIFLSQYGINKEEFNNSVRRIIRLVLDYVNNEYQELRAELAFISEHLPLDKWKDDFVFVSMAVVDTIKEVSFQTLIKPIENGNALKTGILKIILNQNDNANKEVRIEFNAEKLGEFIEILKSYQEKL